MSKQRHAPWRFTAPRDRNGRPLEFHDGIPARDLTERDIVRLSDEQYAIVEASRLYEQEKAPAAKAKEPVKKEEASADKPD